MQRVKIRAADGTPDHLSGQHPMTKALICPMGPVPSEPDADQAETRRVVVREPIGGQVERVSPTPAKPTTRMAQKIMPATIMTYLFSK